MELHVVCRNRLSEAPAMPHNPLPIETATDQAVAHFPGKGANVSALRQRRGHIAAIADDVNEQCVGDQVLDEWQVQHPFRRILGPACHSLSRAYFTHHQSQEISAIFAFRKNPAAYGSSLQPGTAK